MDDYHALPEEKRHLDAIMISSGGSSFIGYFMFILEKNLLYQS